jgi:hypothetical protein
LVGDWTWVEGCVDRSVATAEVVSSLGFCPTAVLDRVDVGVSGTLSFRPDMSYAASQILSLSMDLRLPLSCLAGLSCSAFNAAIQLELLQNPDPAVESITCNGTAACTCRILMTPVAESGSGTYTTSGTTIASSLEGGPTELDEYCVRGDSLHVLEVGMTMSMGPMGRVTILGDLMATRAH